MAEQFSIYLAVPGTSICWGTVTGVINSTRAHRTTPYNAGYGFSGVEDFNILWADAHNLYEAGAITHFAMLHGDITPAPDQFWLDILLEEMVARNATLVSAVSPIKDGRGVSSTGIADLDDPWKPFRRFTMREIHAMPPTFDNVAAGYPDRPLLHNTGMWVCDLRKPVFHAANERGELDLYFEFPTSASRGADGKWSHRRQSEDWVFSRDLWLRGVRDTYVTSRIHLEHHGEVRYRSSYAWGSYIDGDEDTAEKWRPEKEALPLRLVQLLEFELGTGCNLGGDHSKCPNCHIDCRAFECSHTLDDDTIVRLAVEAYRDLGFTGLIGWAYYNEPLLCEQRMFVLMERIKAEAPAARFILWTNGMLIPEDCEQYRQFSQIVISGYNDEGRRGHEWLAAKGINARLADNPALDDRLLDLEPADPTAPCLRPFTEFIIDNYGNTYLCCYDWRGRATFGNVLADGADFAAIAQRWRDQLPSIAGPCMTDDAPDACRKCGHRWDHYQPHDDGIVERARRWRAKLEEEAVPCQPC